MVVNVIYHIGNTIDSQTIVKKGKVHIEALKTRIESSNAVHYLDNIKNVALYKMNGLGTMVKITNDTDTIYLAVPRIFIDKGTGFAIINYFATKKLYNELKSKVSEI